MKQTRLMWDMPITIEIVDSSANDAVFERIFSYFQHVDSVFNIFDSTSEMSRINRGEIAQNNWSHEVCDVIRHCKETKKETNGYFEYVHNGRIDPLGIVKGWAIQQAAEMLTLSGFENFYIDAGGDVQVHGVNASGNPWAVGIRNPFDRTENVKLVRLTNCGIATSGTYIRGNHIHNPFQADRPITDIVSLTVIGPNVYEADRFATPAFAMGLQGIYFIEHLQGFEGYMIDAHGIATFTRGFEKYVMQSPVQTYLQKGTF